MLKKRLIPMQLLLDGRLVKSRSFTDFRDVGDPIKSSKVYNDQYADELVILNIARENRSIQPLLACIEAISAVCFMPLALGGGIQTFADAATLIKQGADKVVLNSVTYTQPQLIDDIVRAYGSQAVIVAIDVVAAEGEWRCVSDCGQRQQLISLADHLNQVCAMGAGEILIQSIDRDGHMEGYDIALGSYVASLVDIPVIIAGGAGNYEHLRDAFIEADVDALAMGSLFNFSDSNPIRAKAFLSNYDLPFKVV